MKRPGVGLEVAEVQQNKISRTCLVHGPYEVAELCVMGKVINTNPPCPTCTSESYELREKETRERELMALKNRLLVTSGIPKLMYGKRLSEYESVNSTAAAHREACIDYVYDWESGAEKRRNLIFSGGVGTGKTSLVCGIGQAIISKYAAGVRYTRFADMTRHVMERFGDRNYPQSEAIERFASVPLLIIDEIGVDLGTKFVKQTLIEIIDKRYGRNLPTFLISNLTVSELVNATDLRVIDRLRENGTVLSFDWESYRGGKSAL